jgi:Flp pilus assembly protein CpaB
MSTLPIAVNRDRAEKGVIIAQPGKTSLALRSTAHTTESSFK